MEAQELQAAALLGVGGGAGVLRTPAGELVWAVGGAVLLAPESSLATPAAYLVTPEEENGEVRAGGGGRGGRVHSLAPLSRASPRQTPRAPAPQVSCLALSPSGRLLAVGHRTSLGLAAPVVLWDLVTRSSSRAHRLHTVRVAALAFSPCEGYLATLGGADDGNLLMWSVEGGAAVCGAPAHTQAARALAFLPPRAGGSEAAPCPAAAASLLRLATVGDGHMRMWEFDPGARKLCPIDAGMGQVSWVRAAARRLAGAAALRDPSPVHPFPA